MGRYGWQRQASGACLWSGAETGHEGQQVDVVTFGKCVGERGHRTADTGAPALQWTNVERDAGSHVMRTLAEGAALDSSDLSADEGIPVPRAFITGITGQDGQHLAEFLHGKGYEVFGMVKGQHNPRMLQLREEFPYVELMPGDLADLPSLVKALDLAQPDEVYNLAAISFVAMSFNQAELTANITGTGVLRMLDAVRIVGGSQNNPIRFYQASSSEMFGQVRETPQVETTPFHPRSPYGCAKVFGHGITVNYRESYGLFACSGILFNHEGPRRGLEFVTRKVTNAVARIKLGVQDHVTLGNLDSKRDWGYAGDYVKAMWMMLQQAEPDDYVIATGQTHSIEDLVERAFAEIGIDDWRPYVRHDPKFLRPAEVDLLIGDASKAREKLGWQPEVMFPELIAMMVANDLEYETQRLDRR